MKNIKTQDALGHVLCHDITQIIPGKSKGVRFRKGHIVTEEDIPVLLSLGKELLYVWESQEGMLHENDAAKLLYDVCAGKYMRPTEIIEGKIEVVAESGGMFTVDAERLFEINLLGEVSVATRNGGFPVKPGDRLAAMRVIPLVIEKTKLERVREIGGAKPLFDLKPFLPKRVGIITVGNEVASGKTKDAFTPVLVRKIGQYGADMVSHTTVGDDETAIAEAITRIAKNGADMILCSGGMSVDPDDRTPAAIRSSGARVVSYGVPVLPGSMFMLAYLNKKIPVLGLPGCVMYCRRTIFDLILPKLMTNHEITARELAALGHGGLCLDCRTCTYPNCGFGKY